MSTKLTETGRRPLRKYETELRDLALYIVNRLDEMREEEDGGEQIGYVETSIWNALFGFHATIPVDKRIAGLQRDLAAAEGLLREERKGCFERDRWQRRQNEMGDRRDWEGLELEGDEPPAACGTCRPCRRIELLARIDQTRSL